MTASYSIPGSLGYMTDLSILEGMGAVISEQETHWVIETPSNPGYYWGNFLLYRAAPRTGDFERWSAEFQRAFAHLPQPSHQCFGWDDATGAKGDWAAFEAVGFEVQEGVVLVTAEPVPPKRPCEALTVRPLDTDAEWDAAITNQVRCRSAGFDEDAYWNFKRRQMRDYRALTRAGVGAWFGAFLGDQLVGDLGLFVSHGVGRFQSVGTNPDYRRRGVCATLVFQAARYAQERMHANQLVIVADPEDQAARIYQSVGFAVAERQMGICRQP
jgi:ribosomal protein S18 acetylase RimI-like enzyme